RLQEFVCGVKRTATGKDRDLLTRIQDVSRSLQVDLVGKTCTVGAYVGGVVWNISFGSELLLDLHFLEIYGNGDVSDAVVRQSGAAGQVRNVLDVSRPHDALVKDTNI